MTDKVSKLLNGIANVGLVNAMSYLWKSMVLAPVHERRVGKGKYEISTLSTRQLPRPIACRYGSTDFKVFNQIFFQDEYGPLRVSRDARLIVDCGAYVGYSTLYFLEKYPNAEVIAVEPDSRNYAMLTRNVAQYGARVTTINAGVWPHKAGLKLRKGEGGEWATIACECPEGEQPDVNALDIPSILGHRSNQRIDLLKLDIEGTERTLFAGNYESWIDRVDTYVIELHGDACRAAFLGALSTGKFDYSESGELTIAHRRG